jgi:hypothetical protein
MLRETGEAEDRRLADEAVEAIQKAAAGSVSKETPPAAAAAFTIDRHAIPQQPATSLCDRGTFGAS